MGDKLGKELEETLENKKCPNQIEIKWTMVDFAVIQTKCHFPIHIPVAVSNSSPFIHVLVECEVF